MSATDLKAPAADIEKLLAAYATQNPAKPGLPLQLFLLSLPQPKLYPLYGDELLLDTARIKLSAVCRQILPAETMILTYDRQSLIAIFPAAEATARALAYQLLDSSRQISLPGRLPYELKYLNPQLCRRQSPPDSPSQLLKLCALDLQNKMYPCGLMLPNPEQLVLIFASQAPHLKFAAVATVYCCELIAKKQNWSPKQILALKTAALWQDSGLLALPLSLLLSPNPISLSQKELLHSHVGRSLALAKIHGLNPEVQQIIAAHHEAPDGSGYPLGLPKAKIPLAAALLKTITAWVEYQQELPWRQAVSAAAALRLIQQKSGSSFSPDAVELLTTYYAQLPLPETINKNYDQACLKQLYA